MKKQKAIRGLAIALLITLFCLPSAVFAKAEEAFEKRLDLHKDGRIYLKNISGDITIKGWSKSEVLVKARKITQRKEDLDNISIDITRTNGTVRIITNYQDGGWSDFSNVSVYYELFVPEKASVEVETVSGNADAREIGGDLGITTVSGDLEIVGAGGGVRARSTSGDLKIVSAGPRVRAKSVSGDIYLQTITGETGLNTISGDITIRDIQGSVEVESLSGGIELKGVLKAENVEVKSTSGRIEYEGELEGRGNYILTTHSGDIYMNFTDNSHFELKTKTLSGEVECDFEVKLSDKISNKEIQGVVGKGGANLILSSFSGDIKIRKK